MKELRIALDIDDTILDFMNAYKTYFNVTSNPSRMIDYNITRNVYKLRKNKEFWEGLDLLEYPDFDPHVYCTKRVNSKVYTKNSLIKQNLPLKPIYQIYTQAANKADILKGRCDILIDDSVFNVTQCIKAGFPALLIDRPHNRWFGPMYRIYNLNYEEIEDTYNFLCKYSL